MGDADLDAAAMVGALVVTARDDLKHTPLHFRYL